MKKRIYAFICSAALLMSSVQVFADQKDSLQKAKQAQSQSESHLQTTQDRIAALEAKKGQTEAYLTELNTQLRDLQSQLQTLQQQYAEKQKELDSVSEDLAAAKQKEEDQLHDMSLRIQVLYEQSASSGFLEALFNAEDFDDFLNRANNFSELNSYDRRMLKEYAETRNLIEEKEKKAKEEQKAIEKLSTESESKKADLQSLVEKTSTELNGYAASIVDQQSEQAKLLSSIESQKANIQALTAQAEQEVEAAEAKASSGQAAATASEKNQSNIKQPQQSNSGNTSSGKGNNQSSSGKGNSGSNGSPGSGSKTPSTGKWNGRVLTRRAGTIMGPSGKETYYNMRMTGVVRIMRNMGNNDPYWVREDGVKMLGDYIMVAANLNVRPRGSHIQTSLGMGVVCDTGTFAVANPYQLDIAVNW